jgi:type I protein arginine methyltransferase
MILDRPARFLVRRVRPRLAASRVMRNALHDISNVEEFGDFHEHEKMLADAVRVDAYQQAIARLVGPDDVVLDVGTGSGILALLAARHGARRVYAVDHSPFIDVARRIADHNGIDTITFVQDNSRAFTPPEPVDVIVHEQMGDDLFNENMLENLLDLKRRVLRPSGRIVPGRFELYVEPVSLKPELRVPHLWENRIHGLDYGFLEHSDDLHRYKRHNYQSHHLREGSVSHFLTAPAPLVVVDLERLEDVAALPTFVEESRPVVEAGTLDGFCVYFTAHLDQDTHLTTSPLGAPVHWGNRLFRTAQAAYRPGDKLAYRVDLPDLTRAGTWSITL